ncbi:MAG: FAD-dependent oxidoreductase [Haloarculaceae archaeon]
MARETEVLVVGGGATGSSVARDLALRGLDVTLVDRGPLADGTSGRSHGLLHSGARYAESDPEGAAECLAENRSIRAVAGECVRDTGGLFVQVSADDADYFAEKRAACEDAGIPVETVDPEDARDRVPGLSEDVERVLAVPDAVVYPSRLVAATAADARDHGASVHTDAPVEAVQTAGGQVTGVDVGGTVDDRIEAEHVVNATGAWAETLAEMAGVDVPMRPTRGVMVSVDYDRVEPVLNRCRAPDDGDIVVPHESEAVLGTTSVPVDDPDDYETGDWEVERSREECAAMLPPVADADVVRTWWGVRPLFGPDEAEHGGRGISRGFFLHDHADEGVAGMASIVGGKLTTCRLMAEATADHVCERLGVDADCETADRPLPGADDPERLDSLVDEFGGSGPTDADVVGSD